MNETPGVPTPTKPLPPAGEIKLNSSAEIDAFRRNFHTVTNLERSQYAINSFNFPFIPIPYPRTVRDITRLAPENVSKGALSHPIYWIDPELTARRPNESEDVWCIRMFYLIDAFELWDDKARYLEYLQIKRFNYDEADIKAYHNKHGQPSALDNYPLLTEMDFRNGMTLDQVELNFSNAVYKCLELTGKEVKQSLMAQAGAVSSAIKALGGLDKIYNYGSSFSDSDGVWARNYRAKMNDISVYYQYNVIKYEKDRNHYVPLDRVFNETRKVAEHLIEYITEMNRAASILNVVVSATLPDDVDAAHRLSIEARIMSEYARADNVRRVEQEKMLDIVEEQIVSGEYNKKAVNNAIGIMADRYREAWNRLRLAYINYRAVKTGNPRFNNYISMMEGLTKLEASRMQDQKNSIQNIFDVPA